MPRPRKFRRVCALPQNTFFGPINNNINNKANDINIIRMTVEEYEAIRLIDYERLMQEECAEVMNVARTTVQRIYNNARIKISKALVEGKQIVIQGGDYKLCSNLDIPCGRGHCHGRNRLR